MIVLKPLNFYGTVPPSNDGFRPAGHHTLTQRPHILSVFHFLQDEILLLERSISRLCMYQTKWCIYSCAI